MLIQNSTSVSLLICLFVSTALGQSPESDVKQQRTRADKSVTEQLAAAYQEFIDEVRATTERGQQIKILSDATAEFNALLKPILLTDEVTEVFPMLVRVQLINIDNSFEKVIDQHPSSRIRALALLNFAKHCSNNRRDKVAKESLLRLKDNYGTMDYKNGLTFADAAEDAIFFASNVANGCPAPNFTGKDADGMPFELQDYRGKVVMLRFWGDWCPPCRAMYDFERELVRTYKSKDFALIGVNSDPLEKMKEAQRRSNLTWRSVWDGGDTGGPIAMLYQVESWPTIVVIDAEGVVQFRSQGLREPQLKSVIERCLASAVGKNQ